MISVRGLSKHYGNLQVLSNVDLEFKKGQSVALIGPNGSGKTTLLKSILGLVIPDQGLIKVQEEDVSHSPKYRKEIGYMSQLSRFPEQMKVGHLFELIESLRKGDENQEPDLWLYNEYKIQKIAHKSLGSLSGGMKQQVSAALAFYYHPEMIILDEPTAGLDPLSNEILKEKINKEVSQYRLVIVTSHILADLEEICNHVTYLQGGKVHLDKPIEEIATETGEKRLNKMVVKLIKEEMA